MSLFLSKFNLGSVETRLDLKCLVYLGRLWARLPGLTTAIQFQH